MKMRRENKILATLVVALDKAFTRFAGESAKVDEIGGELGEAQYNHSFLLQAALEEGSKILGRIYLSKNTARRLAEAFPETGSADGGTKPFELKRFFSYCKPLFSIRTGTTRLQPQEAQPGRNRQSNPGKRALPARHGHSPSHPLGSRRGAHVRRLPGQDKTSPAMNSRKTSCLN